jgi:sugar porter (SP) family MFS transporter
MHPEPIDREPPHLDSGSAIKAYPSFVAVAAAIAALSGLLFGYDTGVISGAILFVKEQFNLDAAGEGTVVSAVLFGATFSSMLSGRATDHWGRKKTILAAAIVFACGSIICGLAPSLLVLVLGRVALGVAIGVASYTAPLYISEISPPQSRGAMVGLNQLAIVIGIQSSYIVDFLFAKHGQWQAMFGIGAVPAVILGLGMLWMPESPRWLVLNQREQEAAQVLAKIRGREALAINAELSQINATLHQAKGTLFELFSPSLRPALKLGIGLGLFQQFTGVNTVIYYAPSIFLMAGFSSNSISILATAAVGAVNIVMTVVGLFLIDKLGRRPLLIVGIGVMTFSLTLLALSFALKLNGVTMQFIGLGSLMLYMAAFAVSLGPIFWLMISEIFPLNIRGLAMSLATSIQWLGNLIVSFSFPLLIKCLGAPATFSIYATISLAALIFAAVLVPETKGLSLEEIGNEKLAG